MSNELYESLQRDDRPLRTINGGTGRIQTMAYLPGGQRLVTGSEDKTIRIRTVGDGRQEGKSMVHAADVRHLAVTSDGSRIISGDIEGNITVWDVAMQKYVEDWKHTERYPRMAMSADGLLAYGNRMIIIREMNNRRTKHEIVMGGFGVSSLSFSSDGSKLAIGGSLDTIIYGVESGHPILTLKGHKGWVNSLQWSRDGDKLYSASSDKTICCWNTETGEQIGRPWTGHTDSISSLSLSQHGTKLASGSWDKTVRVWDTSGHPIGHPLQHHDAVLEVCVSPSNDVVAAAVGYGQISIWRVPWQSDEDQLSEPTPPPIPSVSSDMTTITAYPTTRTLEQRNSPNPENAPETRADSLQGSYPTTRSVYHPQPRDTQSQVVGDPPLSVWITDRLQTSHTINDDHQDCPREPTANEGVESRMKLNKALSRTGRPSDSAHAFPFTVSSTTPQVAPPPAGSTLPHAPTSQNDSSNHSLAAPLDLTQFIVKLEDRYSEGGAFGDVYRCHYNSPTGATEVAVKSFRFRFTLAEGDDASHSVKMVRRELGIWRRLDHPNIVPFLGITTGFGMHGSLALVSAWMPKGSLQSFLQNHGEQLHVAHRLQVLWDVANGLDYLHSFRVSPIVHGDLNGNNVLVDASFTARLTDFGYSTVVGNIPEALAYLQRSTTRPGAIRWSAPELILAKEDEVPERTPKSDIYSFGCLTLQVLSGKQPWSEFRQEGGIAVGMSRGQKPKRPDSRAMDDRHWEFIQRCWSSAEERPTAALLASVLEEYLSSCPQYPSLRDLFSLSSS